MFVRDLLETKEPVYNFIYTSHPKLTSIDEYASYCIEAGLTDLQGLLFDRKFVTVWVLYHLFCYYMWAPIK